MGCKNGPSPKKAPKWQGSFANFLFFAHEFWVWAPIRSITVVACVGGKVVEVAAHVMTARNLPSYSRGSCNVIGCYWQVCARDVRGWVHSEFFRVLYNMYANAAENGSYCQRMRA
jgi:hypothetical protein